MAETFIHTTDRDTITPHIGLCLSVNPQAYGTNVFEVTVDFEATPQQRLTILTVEVTREMLDNQTFPGDDADNTINGFDVLRFEDMDQNGDTHTTYRLMTQTALDAIVGIQHSML